MIQNKDITVISYNHLNLPEKVAFGTGDSLLYFYDAAGIKLRQEVYKAGQLKTKREYVGEFYYENDTLKFINHEEGRVVIANEQLDYQYHLKDHLGNTRLTFSTTPESYTFTATMEVERSTLEEGLFENVAETRVAMTAANSTSQDLVPGANKAARIESTDPIGPLAMLQVNKGDTVKLSAYAYYEGDGSTDGLISESALLAALLSGYSGATGITEVSTQTQAAMADALDFPNNLVPKTNETNDDAPKAFVNYMYFDVDMNFITSGFKQISTAAQFQKELVQMDPLVMEWDGYVMAYVSNESDELNYVHFDDFTIYQGKTHVVYASNYTPFGMQFGEFERTASEPVRYKFQEQEHDTSTGWIAFKWRNYNRKYRRFFNIDPLAEKYLYNSTYAFSENAVVAHRELEGLEKAAVNKALEEGQAQWNSVVNQVSQNVIKPVSNLFGSGVSTPKVDNTVGVGTVPFGINVVGGEGNGIIELTVSTGKVVSVDGQAFQDFMDVLDVLPGGNPVGDLTFQDVVESAIDFVQEQGSNDGQSDSELGTEKRQALDSTKTVEFTSKGSVDELILGWNVKTTYKMSTGPDSTKTEFERMQ